MTKVGITVDGNRFYQVREGCFVELYSVATGYQLDSAKLSNEQEVSQWLANRGSA